MRKREIETQDVNNCSRNVAGQFATLWNLFDRPARRIERFPAEKRRLPSGHVMRFVATQARPAPLHDLDRARGDPPALPAPHVKHHAEHVKRLPVIGPRRRRKAEQIQRLPTAGNRRSALPFVDEAPDRLPDPEPCGRHETLRKRIAKHAIDLRREGRVVAQIRDNPGYSGYTGYSRRRIRFKRRRRGTFHRRR